MNQAEIYQVTSGQAPPDEARRFHRHPTNGETQIYEQWQNSGGHFQCLLASRISTRRGELSDDLLKLKATDPFSCTRPEDLLR
jgi:hypothetical protein